MTGKALDQLQELSEFFEVQGNLDHCLTRLAALTAKILDAANCSIMLHTENEAESMRMRVYATYGELPEAAFAQTAERGEGIAGHVVATGEAILIENVEHSVFASCARRPGRNADSMMAAPLKAGCKLIGVLNLSHPNNGIAFTGDDFATLKLVALLVGRSIQVIQLENLLHSRFAQIALAQDTDKAIGEVMVSTAYDTDKMAKIVAKSFFREMTQAGFGANQIIQAASEIISQLSSSLHKHSKRLDKS